MGLRDAFRRSSVTPERLAQLEESENRLIEAVQELDAVGYTLLNYSDGMPNELRTQQRLQWVKKARVAWMDDPMCAAAVDLMNDFVFGRGVPKPRAKDDEVQEVIDEFWDDPDNQRVLTSYEAQMALGTDLTLQSNVFVLMFDQGDDGKVKLGLLNHDDVMNAVPDPEFRQRVLYYVARHRRTEWDFVTDQPKMDLTGAMAQQQKATYYESWQLHSEPDDYEAQTAKPPANKMGVGCVYHIRLNRGTEQIFGVPTMRRLLRWFNSYNLMMEARVDMAKAASAFVMKRTAKGTQNQVAKIAAKALSRASDLASATGVPGDGGAMMPQIGPRTGSILTENESLKIEPFKMSSGAAEAAEDARMIRAQIAAGTHFPQHYLGDSETANLSVATAIEISVMKTIESRQELFEQLIRWAVDRAIARAVDVGRLDANMTTTTPLDKQVETPGLSLTRVGEAHEDQNDDEAETQRDLSYDFSMPSPLRRMMVDLVGAVAQTAQVFDPNNTNTELSRVLLTLILGEAFEMQDPADIVESIFPEGYVDPAVAAAQAAAQQPPPGQGLGADGQPLPDQTVPGSGGKTQSQLESSSGPGNEAMGGDKSLGAKGSATPAGTARGSLAEATRTRRRDGDALDWRGSAAVEEGHRIEDGDERVESAIVARERTLDEDFATVEHEAALELARLTVTNGNHAD